MTSNQLVQMALSAILRCKEQVDLFDLNDILRGKLSKNVKQKGQMCNCFFCILDELIVNETNRSCCGDNSQGR